MGRLPTEQKWGPVPASVTLRDGQRGDEDDVAWALETATGNMFSLMLGSTWQQVLAEVVAQDGHAWSLSNVRVATVDGATLGAALSASADTPEPEDSLGLGWGWRRMRLSAVALAGWPFLSFMAQHGPLEWYITAIAVRPESRGAGIGHALLADARKKALADGMSALTLDVDSDNGGARRLYASLGFDTVATSRRAWLMGGVSVERMRMALPLVE